MEQLEKLPDLAKGPIDQAAKTVHVFLRTLLGPAAEEMGELLRDPVREYRVQRQLRVLQRSQARLAEAGIEPRSVPLKIIAPLLEGASLEDDESLGERWAGLLTSSAAGDPVEYSYPHILAEIGPSEARVLDILYDSAQAAGGVLKLISSDVLKDRAAIDEGRLPIVLENLIRLRLVDPLTVPGLNTRMHHKNVALTPLGVDFVRACRGPAPGEPRRMPR